MGCAQDELETHGQRYVSPKGGGGGTEMYQNHRLWAQGGPNRLPFIHSFGIGNSCLATNDVTDGTKPMANRPPGSDQPEFKSASHPRSRLPGTVLAPDLREMSDYIHGGALRGIDFDHISHE